MSSSDFSGIYYPLDGNSPTYPMHNHTAPVTTARPRSKCTNTCFSHVQISMLCGHHTSNFSISGPNNSSRGSILSTQAQLNSPKHQNQLKRSLRSYGKLQLVRCYIISGNGAMRGITNRRQSLQWQSSTASMTAYSAPTGDYGFRQLPKIGQPPPRYRRFCVNWSRSPNTNTRSCPTSNNTHRPFPFNLCRVRLLLVWWKLKLSWVIWLNKTYLDHWCTRQFAI